MDRAVKCAVFVGVLVVSAGGARAADDADLGRQIERLVAAFKPGATQFGIYVINLQTGLEVYAHNADGPLKPASNMKLLTVGTALDLLAPSFTYRTTLAMRGNDLIVLGRGDPSLGDPKLAGEHSEPITAMFHAWAAKLKEKGVTEIKGDLVIDDTAFESERLNPNWPVNQRERWYSAPVGALNFNDNCIDVTVRPGGTPGAPAAIDVSPPNTYTTIRNECKTGDKQRPVIDRKGDEPIYVVSGTCKSPGTLQSVAVPDPGLFFASALRTSLAAKGIKIDGKIRRERVRDDRGNLPPTCIIVGVYERQLTDLLGRIDKDSQNLFAECLFKTIAFEMSAMERGIGDGSYATGRKYVERFLEKCGVPQTGAVRIDDGSGYSPHNRVTTRTLVYVLRYMGRHPRKHDFRNSLSRAGEDGTLERRMRDLKGRVQAKTGYISGVYALSGYVTGSDPTKTYCFSTLFNDAANGAEVRKLQDGICRILAGAAGGNGAAATTRRGKAK
jgi:D-alanyl-D-alanine carboxypeptidase/D-alanyl-D-alanine-endopeptidase (penicillin-binding protein 4)